MASENENLTRIILPILQTKMTMSRSFNEEVISTEEDVEEAIITTTFGNLNNDNDEVVTAKTSSALSLGINPSYWAIGLGCLQMSILLLSLSLIFVYLSEKNHILDNNDIFTQYSNTIMFSMFLIRLLTHKYIVFLFVHHSFFFQNMMFPRQEKTACHLGASLWFLFYFPIILQVCYHILENLTIDQNLFFEKWGNYSSLMLKIGMLDQMFELIVRIWDWSMHLHHYGELCFACMLLDFIPLHDKSSGIYLFCLLATLDRLVHFVHGIAHIVKEREIFLLSKMNSYNVDSNEEENVISGVDLLLPSQERLAQWYWWSFWYYVVFLRILVILLVSIYCTYQWSFLSLLWKVVLPAMVILFIVVDVECYFIIWKRSHLS